METQGYGKYVADNIEGAPFGVPIYTQEIAEKLALAFHIDIDKAKGLVNVNLKRIADKSNLERYQKGIYYKAKVTPFGKTKLNPGLIANNAYVKRNGKVIGYETGPTFLNRIGLTSQLAKYKYYATNAFRQNGSRIEEEKKVIIRKPPTEVNDDNNKYLQLLDAIENKDKTAIDAINPERLILNYIENNDLDFVRLVGFARMNYKKEVLLRLADIAAKKQYETAFR